MIYGVVSLMGAQFLALMLGAIIYSRQKSALDIEKRDRGTFGTTLTGFGSRIDEAMRRASDALLGVERIDLEQYRALAKRLGDAIAEIELLKAKVIALEESNRTLNNKLSSRSRSEKPDKPEEPAEPKIVPFTGKVPKQGEFEIPAGVDPAEYLKQIGVGVPLNPPPPYVQETLPLEQNQRPGFGAVARR